MNKIYILCMCLIFVLLSCNTNNNIDSENSQEKLRRIMADSLISNNFLGFELGSNESLIKRKIDSLSNIDAKFVAWYTNKETSHSSSSNIEIKGQKVVRFWSPIFFQRDSMDILKKEVVYLLSFYDNKLYSINADILSYDNIDKEDSIVIFKNYTSKYGCWYDSYSKTTKKDKEYDKIDFKGDVVYKSIDGINNKKGAIWSFKNVNVLIYENDETLRAYQRATMSDIYSKIITLINSTGSVREETTLGRNVMWSLSENTRKEYVKSYITNLRDNVDDEYNSWAGSEIYRTITSSFDVYQKPIEYMQGKYLTINYVDKTVDKFLRDSLVIVEQEIEVNRQKQIKEKRIEESIRQDSINKIMQMRLKNQNI